MTIDRADRARLRSALRPAECAYSSGKTLIKLKLFVTGLHLDMKRAHVCVPIEPRMRGSDRLDAPPNAVVAADPIYCNFTISPLNDEIQK